jgi:hypothetical protein
MTTTLDTPTTATTPSTTASNSSTTEVPNARGEAPFLRAEGYTLTARQIVLALAAHLTYFGDTLAVRVVDPLAAIDAHMRFNGNLTAWTAGRTPVDVAAVRARAEQIARDYFGTYFPAIPW